MACHRIRYGYLLLHGCGFTLKSENESTRGGADMECSQPQEKKPWACACCAMEEAELAQTLRDAGCTGRPCWTRCTGAKKRSTAWTIWSTGSNKTNRNGRTEHTGKSHLLQPHPAALWRTGAGAAGGRTEELRQPGAAGLRRRFHQKDRSLRQGHCHPQNLRQGSV